MTNLDELKVELKTTKTLRTITGAYSDVSALRVVSLKKAFEQNSQFYEQITQLYHTVRISDYFQRMHTNKKLDERPLQPKTIHIALTSNQHFYGNINRDIAHQLLEETERKQDECIIVGLTGREYIEASGKHRSCSYIVFQSERPTAEEEADILKRVDGYDRVFVYYPKFVTMLTQVADMKDITFAPAPSLQQRREIKYIFEPDLPKLLDFFRHQIRSLLFSQVLLETELARTATRLVAMDTAEKKAEEQIGKLEQLIRTSQQAVSNRALIESIVWRTQQHM